MNTFFWLMPQRFSPSILHLLFTSLRRVINIPIFVQTIKHFLCVVDVVTVMYRPPPYILYLRSITFSTVNDMSKFVHITEQFLFVADIISTILFCPSILHLRFVNLRRVIKIAKLFRPIELSLSLSLSISLWIYIYNCVTWIRTLQV